MKFCLQVKPGASLEKLVENPDRSFTVFVTKRPQKGQANKAAIELLARHFRLAKSRFKITQGKKSKFKIVEVE